MADPWFFSRLLPGVRLAGTILDGVLRGPEAVKAQVRAVGACYSGMTVRWHLDAGDRQAEEYAAQVRGHTIFGTGTFHFDERGEIDEIVVNHRPLGAALVLAGLVGGDVAPGLAVSGLGASDDAPGGAVAASGAGSADSEGGVAPGDPPSAGSH
ncbi:hypothetical protein [Amycolatopsis sp. DSM 110486]|uniref:hypothetical protein n=1 Tax=Amycolatopsis sp. DSM 110486 TaxID=2865832 RepID=UPI001C69FA73|nr:hypothetical protein [Amycolatopsis sp. DSM 110486]QYN18153.1 hypothetical protein K1T34_36150 [Amycolatopsis sp. DSM 110486]